MDTKDLLTLAGLALSLGGLIATVARFSHEQRKATELQVNAERRLEYKLRIYQLLIDQCLDFNALVDAFRDTTPTSEIDQIELRKCIYEMLVEGTLVTFEDRIYTAATVNLETNDMEE